MNQMAAQAFCISHDAFLITITSQEEYNWVSSTVLNNNKHVWVTKMF